MRLGRIGRFQSVCHNSTASADNKNTQAQRSITTDQVYGCGRTSGANNSLVQRLNNCKTAATYTTAVDFTDADNKTSAEYNTQPKTSAGMHIGVQKKWLITGGMSITDGALIIKVTGSAVMFIMMLHLTMLTGMVRPWLTAMVPACRRRVWNTTAVRCLRPRNWSVVCVNSRPILFTQMSPERRMLDSVIYGEPSVEKTTRSLLEMCRGW